uniref:beta strand repeat-containing protein n=1 Tax=Aquabacterium sp. TaxID=1872578 RepID=UPI0025C6D345
GVGTDTANYSASTAGVTVDLRLSTAQTGSGDAAGDILSGIENLTGSATAANTLTGDANANVLTGGSASDIFDGLGGADTFNGGAGFDWARYALGSAGVVVNMNNTALNTGDAAGDVYNSIENLDGSSYADTLVLLSTVAGTIYGRAGNDTLVGSNLNDTLMGGTGDDSIDGGTGTDSSIYNITNGNGILTTLAQVSITAGGTDGSIVVTDSRGTSGNGTDTLTNIESLVFTDTTVTVVNGTSSNDTLSGAANQDVLVGGAGNDRLAGGAGADWLFGGTGTDTVDYSASTAGVTVNLGLATAQVSTGDASGDILTSIEAVVGSAYNDTLYAGATTTSLQGGAGTDLLWAGVVGTGTLTMDGGDGNNDNLVKMVGGFGVNFIGGNGSGDLLNYNNSSWGSSGVTVDLTGGTVSGGIGAGDTFSGIEFVQGTAYNDSLTGDGQDNSLNGAAGNDNLSGMAGNDTLRGDLGNDTLDGGAGTDIATYKGTFGTAAALATITFSNASGDNVLTVSDSTVGGQGTDTLTNIESLVFTDVTVAVVNGTSGNDTLAGTASRDVLVGGAGDDTLTAVGTGSDWLFGGTGNDTLVATSLSLLSAADGGSGSDVLQITTPGLAVDLSGFVGVASNVETLQLSNNTADMTLTLSAANVVSLTDSNHDLVVKLDSGDTLNISSTHVETGRTTDASGNTTVDYSLYTSTDTGGAAAATLHVQYLATH